MDFEIEKLDINKLFSKPCAIEIVGMRNTGKSFIVRDFIMKKENKTPISIINKHEHSIYFYKKFMKEEDKIYNNYDNTALKDLFQDKSEKMMILDDCFGYPKLWYENYDLCRLFFNGKDNNISYIVTCQYMLAIPQSFRPNIDFIFFLTENSRYLRRKIYENYFNFIDNYDKFEKIFEQLTEDYGAIVVNIKNNKILYHKADNYDFENSDDTECNSYDEDYWKELFNDLIENDKYKRDGTISSSDSEIYISDDDECV